MDTVPDPLLAKPGIEPGTPVLVARHYDHQTTEAVKSKQYFYKIIRELYGTSVNGSRPIVIEMTY
jgi:hypothetical protein